MYILSLKVVKYINRPNLVQKEMMFTELQMSLVKNCASSDWQDHLMIHL